MLQNSSRKRVRAGVSIHLHPPSISAHGEPRGQQLKSLQKRWEGCAELSEMATPPMDLKASFQKMQTLHIFSMLFYRNDDSASLLLCCVADRRTYQKCCTVVQNTARAVSQTPRCRTRALVPGPGPWPWARGPALSLVLGPWPWPWSREYGLVFTD